VVVVGNEDGETHLPGFCQGFCVAEIAKGDERLVALEEEGLRKILAWKGNVCVLP
jgi:hypothetical protein